MNINEIKQMIVFDEGLSTNAYYCPTHHLTVGIGHNLEADPATHILHRTIKIGEKISLEEVEALFQYDLNKCVTLLTQHLTYYHTLQEKYKIVLVNMVFNIGINGVLKFKNMLTAMQLNNDELVIQHIKDSKYYNQVPNRANRLIRVINDESISNVYVDRRRRR